MYELLNLNMVESNVNSNGVYNTSLTLPSLFQCRYHVSDCSVLYNPVEELYGMCVC